MPKSFALSLFIHLVIAGLVYLVANPLRMIVNRDRDQIAVSVVFNSPAHDLYATREKPRVAEVATPRPQRLRPEHYHADPGDKAAVEENREAHAPQPEANHANTDAGGGHTGSLDENSEYLRAVLELVAKAKRYPKLSQEREEQGLVILAVAIRADGSIVDVRPEQTTSYDRLNRAAVETVRSIQKFPPPPPVGAELLTLHIPIRFKIDTP